MNLSEAVQVAQVLGHENRWRIIALLLRAPASVSALAGALQLTRPNVSNHLALLRKAALVEAEPRGRRISYRLTEEFAPLITEMWERLGISGDPSLAKDAWNADGVD